MSYSLGESGSDLSLGAITGVAVAAIVVLIAAVLIATLVIRTRYVNFICYWNIMNDQPLLQLMNFTIG